jgi:putrescine importer
MDQPTGRTGPDDGSGVQLRRVLGTGSVLLFGLAYMLPLAVFTTYGVVTVTTGGHLAGAYLVTTVAMLFTAYSYANLSRVYPAAGSAYTYTLKNFGAHLGFLAGWALLLDYLFLPLLNYLVIGIYLNAQFPAVPAWAWVLIAAAVVTALNVVGVNVVANLNFVLVGAQFVFVVIFVVACVHHLSQGGAPINPLAPLFSSSTHLSDIAAGSAILCLAFLGFDAVSTLSEEARQPSKSIPRAIMLTTLIGGITFVVVAYAGGLVFPDWQRFSSADAGTLDVMQRAGGAVLAALFTAAFIAGSFASAMTSQVSVARILYAMGRDEMLPRRVFGALHRRFQTPYLNALLVGAVGLLALVISLDTASSMISFGALIAFTFVNLAVIKHFLVDGGERSVRALIRYGLAPGVGFVLSLWLWTSLSRTTFVIGICWLVVGFAYLVYLTQGFRRRPPVMDFSEEAPAVSPATTEPAH